MLYLVPMLVYKLCEEHCPEKMKVAPGVKLGGGADGEVFEIEDDPTRVIKYCVLYETGSVPVQQTYKYISGVVGHLIKEPSPTHATVFDHQYLGLWQRQVAWGKGLQKYILYCYTMERLNTITDDEGKVFHTLLSHEDRGIKKNYSSEVAQQMIKEMNQGLDFDVAKVTFFCHNFKKTPIIHYDVHPRNIMKDSAGNFKLIDFDRSTLEIK